MNVCHMNEVLEHITHKIALMCPGEVTDCKGLIDPGVWKDVPSRERRNAFGRPVSTLVAQDKVDLEYAGLDRARHNLYRKIEK